MDPMEHLLGKTLYAHGIEKLNDKARVGTEHTLTYVFLMFSKARGDRNIPFDISLPSSIKISSQESYKAKSSTREKKNASM